MRISRRELKLGALTVTAAAALLASPASASTRPAAEMPPTAASWHGQPIRQPAPRPPALAANGAAPTGRSLPVLRPGTGYARPGGSLRVRALQRMLRRLGYQSGPIDGLYGPLTAASVRWFQIKHGFAPTGVVDASTVAYLRLRVTGGTSSASAARPAGFGPAAPAHPSSPASVAAAPDQLHGSSAGTFLLVAIAVALLGLTDWLAHRRPVRRRIAGALGRQRSRARELVRAAMRFAVERGRRAARQVPLRARASLRRRTFRARVWLLADPDVAVERLNRAARAAQRAGRRSADAPAPVRAAEPRAAVNGVRRDAIEQFAPPAQNGSQAPRVPAEQDPPLDRHGSSRPRVPAA